MEKIKRRAMKKMILYPKALLKNVREITIEFIKRNRLKALILDVDNTLIDYYKNLPETTIKWAKELQGQGVKLYILSNSNKKEKIETVANKLGIKYKMFGKKPLKGGFLQIQKELGISPESIGVVGDQIFTDIVGGNRCNMFTILVEPVDKKDIFITAWKRPIEEMIKNKYRKQSNKGEK